ncbi:MAG: hypothetical protein JNL50_09625, partial [Phycisphaerae bacterium]|nr:hypothetical protein [Phycisphaerae bacterium]
MRTKNGQDRAIPWSLVWSLAGIVGVVVAGSVGAGPRRAEAATEVWTAAAAPPANVTPGVTARSCIACHRFEQVHTHPTNVMATMPVPGSLPLAGGLVTCLTCHDASSDHATSRKPVGIRGGADGPGLCVQCHTKANSNTKAIHAVRTGKA